MTQHVAEQAAMHAATKAALSERHYVQFHPLLAELLGGFKPALMLGHALYWTRNWMLSKAGARDGWFWKTTTEWRDATGLTTREQEGARQVLRDSGVWHEALIGQPHGQGTKLHFRVDLAELTAKLMTLAQGIGSAPAASPAQARHPASQQAGANISDADSPVLLTRLLAAPVMFYRALADVAGGPAPGLLLSWLLARMGEAIQKRTATAEGFFLFELSQGQQRLCLGPKVVRNARETLERTGLITVGYAFESRGRLMVRVNLMALTACLSGQNHTPRKRVRPTPGARPEPVPVQASLLQDRPNRAQVLRQDANVTHVTRILMGSASAPSLPMTSARYAQQDAQTATTSGGESHFAVLSKRPPPRGISTCRFVEMGVAVLSNLNTKEITKPTPTPVGETAKDSGRRSRSLDLPFWGQNKASKSEVPGKAPAFDEDAMLPPVDPAPAPASLKAAEQALVASSMATQADAEALVMPKRLDPALHQAARTMVLDAPTELRQAVLDELEGRMASKRNPIEDPLGWLYTVVTKAKQGTLVLTLAYGVAKDRQAAQAHAERMSRVGRPAAEAAAEPSALVEQNEPSPEQLAARAKLAELKMRFAAGVPKGELS